VSWCAETGTLHQAPGGARAWNRECGEDAEINSADACGWVEPKLTGNGKTGAAEGAEFATSWINAQIAQPGSSDPSGLWPAAPPPGKTPPDAIAVADAVEAGAGL
jgi:hypothetical protein